MYSTISTNTTESEAPAVDSWAAQKCSGKLCPKLFSYDNERRQTQGENLMQKSNLIQEDGAK